VACRALLIGRRLPGHAAARLLLRLRGGARGALSLSSCGALFVLLWLITSFLRAARPARASLPGVCPSRRGARPRRQRRTLPGGTCCHDLEEQPGDARRSVHARPVPEPRGASRATRSVQARCTRARAAGLPGVVALARLSCSGGSSSVDGRTLPDNALRHGRGSRRCWRLLAALECVPPFPRRGALLAYRRWRALVAACRWRAPSRALARSAVVLRLLVSDPLTANAAVSRASRARRAGALPAGRFRARSAVEARRLRSSDYLRSCARHAVSSHSPTSVALYGLGRWRCRPSRCCVVSPGPHLPDTVRTRRSTGAWSKALERQGCAPGWLSERVSFMGQPRSAPQPLSAACTRTSSASAQGSRASGSSTLDYFLDFSLCACGPKRASRERVGRRLVAGPLAAHAHVAALLRSRYHASAGASSSPRVQQEQERSRAPSAARRQGELSRRRKRAVLVGSRVRRCAASNSTRTQVVHAAELGARAPLPAVAHAGLNAARRPWRSRTRACSFSPGRIVTWPFERRVSGVLDAHGMAADRE
jgi:hypothetical protein